MKRSADATTMPRRRFLVHGSALGGERDSHVTAHFATDTLTQPFENGTRELVAYPQKRPLLRITARPPHLETPFHVFNEGGITPTDAFFVRCHLANIPTSIDLAGYRLSVVARWPRRCHFRWLRSKRSRRRWR